ncbi:DUF975 family protein [Acidaminobacter sp. JC074]|uniref:DUF975 family protein n=1 Tax=Acidaminobacter sp. JC074 TaxID=2530199 RepID=UPI001F100D31|nr:DUF975 family protein [Acidaminobacter sp. JC074]MCH4888869.1 DUF975 family protein [Acidaminobacter sp. JC074]
MWTRAELKDQAKAILKKSYWKAFLVSLILAVIGGGSSGGGSNSRFNFNGSSGNFNDFRTGFEQGYNGTGNVDVGALEGVDFSFFFIFLGIFLLIFLAIILFRVLVGTVVEVGCQKYFIKATEEEFSINHVMSGFKKGKYGNIVLTMLYRGVLLFLWTLLLIIPGIIKSYAYRFVPYIMADNPEITPKRAIEMSNQMTNGQKFDMFVLDVSFIGWYILGTLALGIGVLFVNPYPNQTFAHLYVRLRGDLINSGQSSYAEFNLSTPEDIPVVSDEWESVFDREDY